MVGGCLGLLLDGELVGVESSAERKKPTDAVCATRTRGRCRVFRCVPRARRCPPPRGCCRCRCRLPRSHSRCPCVHSFSFFRSFFTHTGSTLHGLAGHYCCIVGATMAADQHRKPDLSYLALTGTASLAEELDSTCRARAVRDSRHPISLGCWPSPLLPGKHKPPRNFLICLAPSPRPWPAFFPRPLFRAGSQDAGAAARRPQNHWHPALL